MSFRCEKCKKPQDPYTKPIKLPTKIRKVTYIHQGLPGNPKSEGFEIVEEIKLCPQCFEEFKNFQPQVVENIKRVVKS
ncbi:hypothetical protein H5T58_01715 [Candidatus Parcubacteria bacterium]|nr:hypothetical protein [Candidatus Parcubacteria bacterium]